MDEDRLQDFSKSDLYGHLRYSILSQDPLPSLNRAYQMFLEEEGLQLAAKGQNERDVRAVAIKTGAHLVGSRMSNGTEIPRRFAPTVNAKAMMRQLIVPSMVIPSGGNIVLHVVGVVALIKGVVVCVLITHL